MRLCSVIVRRDCGFRWRKRAITCVPNANIRPGARGSVIPCMYGCGGHIDLMPSAEESQGLVPTLVIDSLLGFDDNQACNPGVMMVGIYVSEDGSGRSVLHLRSDYTCSFQNYGADGSAEHREGRWGLVAEEELALLLPPSTLTEQMPVLDPDAGSDQGYGARRGERNRIWNGCRGYVRRCGRTVFFGAIRP